MIYYLLRVLEIVVFINVIPSFLLKLTSRCTCKKQQVDSNDLSNVKLSCKSRKRVKTKSLSKDDRVLQEKRKLTEERWTLKHDKMANDEKKIKQEEMEKMKSQIDTELSKKEKKAKKIQKKLELEEQQRLAEEEAAKKRLAVKERLRNERIKQLEEIKAEEERRLPEIERKQMEWKEYEEKTVETVKKQILAEEDMASKRQGKKRNRNKKKKIVKEIKKEEESKQMELKDYGEITQDVDEMEQQEDDFCFEYIFDDSKSRTIWFLNKHTQERIYAEILGLPCPVWPGVTSGWDQSLVEEGLSALENFFLTEEVDFNFFLPPYIEVSIWVLHCIMILELRLKYINWNRWDYHRTELLSKWFTNMRLNQDILTQITDDMDKYGVFNSRESALYTWIKTQAGLGGIYLFFTITEFQSGNNKGLEAWENLKNQNFSSTYYLKYKAHRKSKYCSTTRISI